MADEAYRAVFLRVHPTGKMVLSLTTEADGNEGALRAARRLRARRAGARRQGRPGRREPLRRRARVQHEPVRRRPDGDRHARPRRSAPRRSCSRARRSRPPRTTCAGRTACSSAPPARARSPTSPSTPTAPASSRPGSKAGSTRRPSTDRVTATVSAPRERDADGPHRQGRRRGQGRPQPRDRGPALAGLADARRRRADRRRPLDAGRVRQRRHLAARRREKRTGSRRRSTKRSCRAGTSRTARAPSPPATAATTSRASSTCSASPARSSFALSVDGDHLTGSRPGQADRLAHEALLGAVRDLEGRRRRRGLDRRHPPERAHRWLNSTTRSQTGKPADYNWDAVLDLDRIIPCVEGGKVLEREIARSGQGRDQGQDGRDVDDLQGHRRGGIEGRGGSAAPCCA